jgi:hypothetical protein
VEWHPRSALLPPRLRLMMKKMIRRSTKRKRRTRRKRMRP